MKKMDSCSSHHDGNNKCLCPARGRFYHRSAAHRRQRSVGLVVGPEFEYFVSSRFSFAAGLNYSQQGADLKDTNVEWKVDYLTVPVVANVYLFKGFALKAGLQPGFKTSAKMEYKGSMGSASVNLKNDVKGFDLAVPVGLSYEFKHFVLDARYTFGLTKVFDDFDTKNLTFQLTLGYKIDL